MRQLAALKTVVFFRMVLKSAKKMDKKKNLVPLHTLSNSEVKKLPLKVVGGQSRYVKSNNLSP